MATLKFGYDHGYGVENTANYCERHGQQEEANVEIDNSNRRAGIILF